MIWPAVPVVAPLLAAALLAGAGSWLPRRVLDLTSCLIAGFVGGVCALLALRSRATPIVYWFGGWRPHGHFPLGISFVIDPIGAGLATLVSLLMLAAFLFSWQYFESVKSLFHAVMLVFHGAMCGLCLTGDLFNMFVWFELMSAAAVMLCGYMSEETGPLQGALNFAITNTLGAYLSLTGLAWLYARTGALNFAEVGRTLADHNPGGLFLAAAFLFVSAGFLVKAAVFPFQFWLTDAHAVAPTPVCVLFSGVMVELGLYAVARIYWTIFSVPLAGAAAPIRTLFLAIGSLTALVGAIQCFGQRHLKRLLALSTISHMGLMILGFGLMLPRALAGTALYVVGHGMVKGCLFICAGILLHHFGSVDEYELRGAGRGLPGTAVLMTCGALGLAGLPPFANFWGEEMIYDAAKQSHAGWLLGVFFAAGMLTAGAVLRVAGRVFLGWGRQPDATAAGAPRIPMKPETGGEHGRTPVAMLLPAASLIGLAVAVVPLTGLHAAAEQHAQRMEQFRGYAAAVLDGARLPPPDVPRRPPELSLRTVWRPGVAFAGALLLALAALFPKLIGEGPAAITSRLVVRLMQPFRMAQSGRVGDYVTWLVVGLAAYGLFLMGRIH